MKTEQVLRMEDDEGFGPFTAMPDPKEMVKHVPWMKIVKMDYAGRFGNDAYGIASDDEHPHHQQDIPGANLGGEDMGTLEMLLGSPWKVGVKDQQQFLHWFPASSLNWFAHQGFKLDIYKVPENEVKTGTYQVMFNSDDAQLVKSEPLTQLAKEISND